MLFGGGGGVEMCTFFFNQMLKFLAVCCISHQTVFCQKKIKNHFSIWMTTLPCISVHGDGEGWETVGDAQHFIQCSTF